MNEIDIKNIKTSKRYSRALLEAAGENLNEIYDDLFEIKNLISTNADFRMFFSHPVVSLKDKKEALREIFESKIHPKTFDFLNILLDENRFEMLNTITQIFKKEIENYKNQQTATVISAIDLEEDEKERIKQKLSSKLNKEIILNCEKNEDILAGLIIKINDKVIDLSLKNKFNTLRKA